MSSIFDEIAVRAPIDLESRVCGCILVARQQADGRQSLIRHGKSAVLGWLPYLLGLAIGKDEMRRNLERFRARTVFLVRVYPARALAVRAGALRYRRAAARLCTSQHRRHPGNRVQ